QTVCRGCAWCRLVASVAVLCCCTYHGCRRCPTERYSSELKQHVHPPRSDAEYHARHPTMIGWPMWARTLRGDKRLLVVVLQVDRTRRPSTLMSMFSFR